MKVHGIFDDLLASHALLYDETSHLAIGSDDSASCGLRAYDLDIYS